MIHEDEIHKCAAMPGDYTISRQKFGYVTLMEHPYIAGGNLECECYLVILEAQFCPWCGGYLPTDYSRFMTNDQRRELIEWCDSHIEEIIPLIPLPYRTPRPKQIICELVLKLSEYGQPVKGIRIQRHRSAQGAIKLLSLLRNRAEDEIQQSKDRVVES